MITFYIAGLLIVIGILIKYFKQYWLIAGYNTAAPDVKKKIDINKYSKVIANLCFVIATVLIITGYFDMQDPKIEVTSEHIKIHGVFGSSTSVAEIKGITRIDQMPKIIRKNFGSDPGKYYKGEFTLEDLGKGHIYITENKPPYIYIKTDKSFIIINFNNPDKTKKLLKELQDKYKKL